MATAHEGQQKAAQLINDLQDISFTKIGLIVAGTWLAILLVAQGPAVPGRARSEPAAPVPAGRRAHHPHAAVAGGDPLGHPDRLQPHVPEFPGDLGRARRGDRLRLQGLRQQPDRRHRRHRRAALPPGRLGRDRRRLRRGALGRDAFDRAAHAVGQHRLRAAREDLAAQHLELERRRAHADVRDVVLPAPRPRRGRGAHGAARRRPDQRLPRLRKAGAGDPERDAARHALQAQGLSVSTCATSSASSAT